MPTLSIIIPCRNEAESLRTLLPEIKQHQPDAEVILVNDGSDDDSGLVAEQAGVTVINRPYSMGNGAAIKTGARHASGDILLFMDADGQHQPKDIQRLLTEMEQGGYDMVVGARDAKSQASIGRWAANGFYNKLSSWMVGHRIADLTSGFRAVVATKFKEFIYLLPNKFSYPSTITMAFFRAGYAVSYVPIFAPPRIGKSHIHPLKDGLRFLLIIFKIGTLYSPLKLFIPLSMSFFSLGIVYYSYTFLTQGRFTNMGALLFISAILIFLIGLVSEQITQVLYSHKESE
ncbi:glycosyltransferase family 2 protein [Candidatus Albibeggiatoa sp. nov. NOAA]|uniref:glycosyltransferase family 2 protein n=1 Tax=Candidatus Albibeggiatoa sp. nov. NOAA TaxID=3162724 RepID=UPI0032FE71EF|nr:glycosyltransferase family 2 protein [Thiotrichaceae bacterium]